MYRKSINQAITPNASRWYRFSLREIMLVTVIAALALALILALQRPKFVPSVFSADLISGNLIERAVELKPKNTNIAHVRAGQSRSPGMLSANGQYQISGALRNTTAQWALSQIQSELEESARKHGCRIGVQTQTDLAFDFHYGYSGGSGIVHVLIAPSHADSKDLILYYWFVELAGNK